MNTSTMFVNWTWSSTSIRYMNDIHKTFSVHPSDCV